MEKLITPKEAAKILGVAPGTVKNWQEAGKITTVKTLGGHRRYYLSQIIELLETLTKVKE
jgi:excisionase family DNA binding protein